MADIWDQVKQRSECAVSLPSEEEADACWLRFFWTTNRGVDRLSNFSRTCESNISLHLRNSSGLGGRSVPLRDGKINQLTYNTVAFPLLSATLLVLALSNSSGHAQQATYAKVWKSSTFLDFVDGTFTDSTNAYVTADGELVLINRLDLDGDGSADVVLPNDHDPNQRADLFIYWDGDSFSMKHRLQLSTNGGSDSATADLNRDGHLDLIVANNFNGTRTDLDSYIYWGGAQGFDTSRRNGLPTLGARAVAVDDLNRDGYPDLVFANSGLGYHVTVDRANRSYVYWGSAEGYDAERRLLLKTVNGRDVAIHDLDRDGHPDLVFANEGNTDEDGGALIYWGSSGGDYSHRPATHLPGERTSAVAVADLNGDEVPEIVLANAYRLRSRELGIRRLGQRLRPRWPARHIFFLSHQAGQSPQRLVSLLGKRARIFRGPPVALAGHRPPSPHLRFRPCV